MRTLTFMVLCLLVSVGCQLFTAFGPDGEVIKEGIIPQLADGANAAGALGVPFASLAGGAIGIIGAIGAWFKHKENKRNLAGMVRLVEVIKPRVKELADNEDLKKLIVKHTDGTKFGAALKRAHAALKKI